MARQARYALRSAGSGLGMKRRSGKRGWDRESPQKQLDSAIFAAPYRTSIGLGPVRFQRRNRCFHPEIKKFVDFLLHCNKKALQARFPSL
jgi:hypothetical protein